MSHDSCDNGDGDAGRYRLAYASKLIRLRFVRRDERGRLVTADLFGVDQIERPTALDPVDFDDADRDPGHGER
jgi:hypothetical protein